MKTEWSNGKKFKVMNGIGIGVFLTWTLLFIWMDSYGIFAFTVGIMIIFYCLLLSSVMYGNDRLVEKIDYDIVEYFEEDDRNVV